MPLSPLLTPDQAAEVLSVRTSQVYTLMRSGQLRAVKIGHRGVWRIHESDLEDYIRRLREEARHRGADELAQEDFSDNE